MVLESLEHPLHFVFLFRRHQVDRARLEFDRFVKNTSLRICGRKRGNLSVAFPLGKFARFDAVFDRFLPVSDAFDGASRQDQCNAVFGKSVRRIDVDRSKVITQRRGHIQRFKEKMCPVQQRTCVSFGALNRRV